MSSKKSDPPKGVPDGELVEGREATTKFEELARKLVGVPKDEIDKARKKSDTKRRSTRRR